MPKRASALTNVQGNRETDLVRENAALNAKRLPAFATITVYYNPRNRENQRPLEGTEGYPLMGVFLHLFGVRPQTELQE